MTVSSNDHIAGLGPSLALGRGSRAGCRRRPRRGQVSDRGARRCGPARPRSRPATEISSSWRTARCSVIQTRFEVGCSAPGQSRLAEITSSAATTSASYALSCCLVCGLRQDGPSSVESGSCSRARDGLHLCTSHPPLVAAGFAFRVFVLQVSGVLANVIRSSVVISPSVAFQLGNACNCTNGATGV
jgi:hypothetical protein